MTMPSGWAEPPELHRWDGQVRRLGVELEFSGLDAVEAADVVQEVLGGRIDPGSRSDIRVDTELGEFRVELDVRLISKHVIREVAEDAGLSRELANDIEDTVASALGAVAPYEVVFPPIPLDQLDAVDRVVEGLREAGATGSTTGVVRNFAMQLNPELTQPNRVALLTHVQAFCVLQEWLALECDISTMRKLMSWAKLYEEPYVQHVLRADYRPSLQTFTADYLRFNPTRDYALDLLPALAWLLDEDERPELLNAHGVRARPTFHYRLPDSRVDDPEWSVAQEWNRWVEVERLAADGERLAGVLG